MLNGFKIGDSIDNNEYFFICVLVILVNPNRTGLIIDYFIATSVSQRLSRVLDLS